MKIFSLHNVCLYCLFLSFLLAYSGCKKTDNGLSELDLYIAEKELINSQSSISDDSSSESTTATTTSDNGDYLLPNIDLNNWKITLPIGNPTSVRPPEILDYANNETLKPFFYISVKVTPHHGGQGYVTPINNIGYKAASLAYEDTFGKKPIPQRSGGSIPIVALFEQELKSKTILMGFGLDSDAIHSPNEHFGLFNYFKGIETIPLFYKYFVELSKFI